MHFIIETAQLHKLCVRAALDDISVADNQDTVGIPYGGETMRYDEAGLILHETAHGSLNLVFRPCIHIGGGLVENQHGGMH